MAVTTEYFDFKQSIAQVKLRRGDSRQIHALRPLVERANFYFSIH
jgi:hypothetical protein